MWNPHRRRPSLAFPDLAKAVTELTALKGVGPATASAVLAAYAPEVAPFMSDEAMMAALGNTKDYTLKNYLAFAEKLQTKAKELSIKDESFTPSDIEMALWSSVVGATSLASASPDTSKASQISLRLLNSKFNGEDNADLRRDRDLVGMDIHMERLVEWLSQEQPRRTIILILGEGGLGKTALASKVFEEEKKERRFESYAWVSVTRSYHGADDLLRRIIHQFFEEENEALLYDISDVERWVLDNNLREFLTARGSSLSSTMCGMARSGPDIRLSFPNINNRSRVIVTTRHREVASFLSNCGGGWYDLTPLDEWAASTLFHRQLVFGGVCIGGTELEERTTSQWEDVVVRLDYILNFSFRDLPNHLRICLLYCSLFPKIYAIKRTRLIRLWTAEGFVQERGEATPEEVAGSYLNELIFRGMLQVVKTNKFGRAREVLMPNMVRELALSMSEAENLLMVYNGVQEAIANTSDQDSQDQRQCSNARPCASTSLPFRLHDDWVAFGAAEDETHDVHALPRKVLKLLKLRHLLGWDLNLQSNPDEPWCLKEIQTLKTIASNAEVVREVGNLTQLRSFWISWVRPADEAALCASIAKMTRLTNLVIVTCVEEGVVQTLHLEGLSPPPPMLQKLGLMGCLDRLPGWLALLVNLKELHLTKSRMTEDPIPFLGRALRNLAYLELDEAYDAQLMQFDARVFPTLKKLCLWNLERLEDIVIEEGAMESLVEFDFRRCGELKAVPVGIEWLANLQELNLEAMPDELVGRLRGGEGSQEDNRVGHIQLIRHWDYMRGRPLECISYKPRST
ncbi:Disease resistance protein RPM1 [Acorus calamus]|uniref:Disease resistance protein RPM1 n=1 Tax=Acorus calamus TaxID=4465 RepID=A0AAV9DFF4_ACOCL|nr:Disease resistance protein RPM1 [Acorus calamus]